MNIFGGNMQRKREEEQRALAQLLAPKPQQGMLMSGRSLTKQQASPGFAASAPGPLAIGTAQSTISQPEQAAVGPVDRMSTFDQPQRMEPAPQPQQTLDDMVGPAPERKKGFWNGQGKFGARDAFAAALAVLADAGARQNGYQGNAIASLGNRRRQSLDDFTQAVQAFAERKRMASLPGMTTREFAAWQANPEAWGNNNSDALSTHLAAANVNPGDQRVYGNPARGGSVYQAPTAGEQYADSLGYEPGSNDYTTALQDYTLRANGPTAFGYDKQLDDYRTGNDIKVEGVRFGNRQAMEAQRQQGRADLRSQPTYRDLNAPPPRRTAARENLPVISTPAEARKLPKGTKFKTPDGRVKIAR